MSVAQCLCANVHDAHFQAGGTGDRRNGGLPDAMGMAVAPRRSNVPQAPDTREFCGWLAPCVPACANCKWPCRRAERHAKAPWQRSRAQFKSHPVGAKRVLVLVVAMVPAVVRAVPSCWALQRGPDVTPEARS